MNPNYDPYVEGHHAGLNDLLYNELTVCPHEDGTELSELWRAGYRFGVMQGRSVRWGMGSREER